ncbi:hypothetical protein K488DRAFT_89724 [Vararia minispora EC-137]|uniref:Uncharacterized protein n=1 Tax=Vararia minispora EC-137 TaxID=1314806 RepID=A0ACB8Q9W4_9AGAM|nr:hypothetical protein K488DRAFT_89724 [Vararia minispora EC-137]
MSAHITRYNSPSPYLLEPITSNVFYEHTDDRSHSSASSLASTPSSRVSSVSSPPRRSHRRVMSLWKRVTRSIRKPERASVLPAGFELMSASEKRRTLLLLLQGPQ